MNGKSYVYTVTHRESQMIYVGKSNNPQKRWRTHVNLARKGRISHFYNALNKYGKEAFDFLVESEHSSEEDAYQHEAELILSLKEDGKTLYNLSEGGRGPVGFKVSNEFRARVSERVKQMWSDPEKRQKILESFRRSWSDPELRARHSEIQKKWSSTPEARAKNSEAQNRPEISEKKSDSVKQRWQEPKYREVWLKGLQSDENRKKHSESMSERWANPVTRKKIVDGMNTPEFKIKKSLACKNEKNPRAKLTWERVRQIRALAVNGNTLAEIRQQGFDDISLCTLNRVVKMKAWIE